MTEKEFLSIKTDFETRERLWQDQRLMFIEQINQLKRDIKVSGELLKESENRYNDIFRQHMSLKNMYAAESCQTWLASR